MTYFTSSGCWKCTQVGKWLIRESLEDVREEQFSRIYLCQYWKSEYLAIHNGSDCWSQSCWILYMFCFYFCFCGNNFN